MKRTTSSGLLFILLLSLGACSSADSDTAPDGAASPGETQSADETEIPVSFKVAMSSPTITDIPTMAALANMAAEGYDVGWVEVAEPELAIEGLATGQSFQFSGSTASAALIAIQQGAPIKLIADLVGYGHAVFAKSDLTECADLDGRRVGIMSEGAVGTAILRYWINANCPEVSPNYLVIGGADLRYLAMVSGEIDATLLPLAEVIQLEQENPGSFTRLANLGEDITDVRPAPFYGNSDYMEANPRATELFMAALLDVYAYINEDYNHLIELAEQYDPGVLPAGLEEEITKAYIDMGMFNLAALNPETVVSTIKFFEDAGVIEPGLTADDVADLSYLDAAIAAAG